MSRFRNDSIFWVDVEKIVPNPYQPRREFDPEKLKELSESIRMYGVLQPLTVSRSEVELENGGLRTEYELIAGERRLRASKLAGISQVPVLIREGEESEQEKLELAIIENLQREDLNAVDRALAFKQLAEQFGMPHSQVAKKVGRSREYVSNSIRLLNLPEVILEALKRAELNEGHARTLLMLNDRPEEQDTVFREILLKKLSVREVERIARKIATDKVRKKDWQGSDPMLIAKEKEFTETLGTRVQIAKTDFGGKLTIDYFSEEDLDHLLELLRTNQAVPKSALAISAIAEEVETPGTVDEETNALEGATGLSFADEDEVVDTTTNSQLHKSDEAQAIDITPEVNAAELNSTPASPLQPTVHEEATQVSDIKEMTAEEARPSHTNESDEAPRAADAVQKPKAAESAPTEAFSLQERVAARLNEIEEPTAQPPTQQKKTDDDSSLYNLNNFSF